MVRNLHKTEPLSVGNRRMGVRGTGKRRNVIFSPVLLAALFQTTALHAGQSLLQPLPAETFEAKGEAVIIKEGPPDKFIKGNSLKQSQTKGSGRGPAVPHIVDPQSIVVKKNGESMEAGRDYAVDPVFATVGTLPGGRLAPGDRVEVDYRYSCQRIDSLVSDKEGVQRVLSGESVVGAPKPPVLPEGMTRLANWYVAPFSKGGDAERFDIPAGLLPPVPTGTKQGCVPRTLTKLEAGEKVKIVCWGDSVTNGGDASSKDKSFPLQLGRLLREKFPNASVDLEVVAAGGSGTVHWLFPEEQKHPTEQEKCNWNRVVEAHPDLVAMEFVNDSYLRGDAFQKHYVEALRRVRELNAELVLVAPHFVYPEEMGFTGLKETDKRPYIQLLKDFSDKNGLAIADVSGAWGNLWREGIPYLSYLKNGINHPDDDGHLLMAQEIVKCFNSAPKTP